MLVLITCNSKLSALATLSAALDNLSYFRDWPILQFQLGLRPFTRRSKSLHLGATGEHNLRLQENLTLLFLNLKISGGLSLPSYLLQLWLSEGSNLLVEMSTSRNFRGFTLSQISRLMISSIFIGMNIWKWSNKTDVAVQIFVFSNLFCHVWYLEKFLILQCLTIYYFEGYI